MHQTLDPRRREDRKARSLRSKPLGDLLQVSLDLPLRKVHRRGDLFVRLSARNQCEHFKVFWRQGLTGASGVGNGRRKGSLREKRATAQYLG